MKKPKDNGRRSPSSDAGKSSPRFPLIAEFVRGYLHQDLVPEYGDPRGAARAYLAELDKASAPKLAKEVALMRNTTKASSVDQMNHQLAQLGSQWKFASIDEFEDVLRILEHHR